MIPSKPIFFDEGFFEDSGIIFWIFRNGLTEYTNAGIHREKIRLIYKRKINKTDKPAKYQKPPQKRNFKKQTRLIISLKSP